MEKQRTAEVQEHREKGGSRGWVILVFVQAAVLLAVLWAGTGIWNEYRDAVMDTQKQQLLLTVQSLGDSVEIVFQDYLEDLEGLYRMAGRERLWEAEAGPVEPGPGQSPDGPVEPGPGKPAGRPAEPGSGQAPGRPDGSADPDSLLAQYVATHQTLVRDVMVEDTRGRIVRSISGLRPAKVCSTVRISDGRSLRMTEMDSGEKDLVLEMEIPGKGSISLVLDLEQYYQALMQQLRVGTSGYMVLKDRDGIILMHPERAQWGIEVIRGRMELYEDLDLDSLQTLIDHQMEGRKGVEEYYSYWWTEEDYPRVRKICAYCPVELGEDFLILSAVMDYDDVYIPVVRGVSRLVILFLVFALVLVAMAVYMAGMMMQKQKDTEQITYLTELNRLLEEMHRSEETIAHQQRLQIMGTMTGGIAHEFNNLLTPIMGYADLLLMELEEDSDSYDNALEIYEASAKAKEIIQQISSLSRKNLETAYRNTDAGRMVARAVKMVRSVCPANVVLKEELDLQGARILCNETQLNQVILNLCVNAIHAIGRQEGFIRIVGRVAGRQELEALNPDGLHLSPDLDNWSRYVCVEIRDNGCGMSREVRNRIFDPFFTTKQGGKGTGLGLALVEQIISSHRGGLYVESQPGKGSLFSLYLPVNGQEGGTGNLGTEGEAPDVRDGSPLVPTADTSLGLLVVDDNPKVLQLLKKDADRLSIRLECAMGFEEARKFLEGQGTRGRGQVEALVAEQEIAGQSGVDFCMAVRGRYPDIAVIVMADQVTRELVEARQRGILDGYISKPVSVSGILAAMKQAGQP